MENTCRMGMSIQDRLEAGPEERRRLRGQYTVGRLPYIGPIFRARLNQEFQVRTLNDLVQRFSHQPAWTAVEIEDEIVRMVRNPNQETCSRGRNNTEDAEPLYHVSDVNQCAFNAIVELLRGVHQRREDHEDLQFDPQPNIPHAADILFRQRGDPGAKRCGCLDENRCNDDDAPCRWTPGAQTGLVDAQGAPMGTCTPNQNNRDGFRRERHNQPDQHMPTMADQAHAQALPNRPNSFYVHQWRVIGGSRHNRITRLEGFDQVNHHRITCDCVPANERPETENRNRLYFEGYLRDGDSPRRIHELNCDCRNEEGWTSDSDSDSGTSDDDEIEHNNPENYDHDQPNDDDDLQNENNDPGIGEEQSGDDEPRENVVVRPPPITVEDLGNRFENLQPSENTVRFKTVGVDEQMGFNRNDPRPIQYLRNTFGARFGYSAKETAYLHPVVDGSTLNVNNTLHQELEDDDQQVDMFRLGPTISVVYRRKTIQGVNYFDSRPLRQILSDITKHVRRTEGVRSVNLSFYVNRNQPANTIQRNEQRTIRDMARNVWWPGLNLERILVVREHPPPRINYQTRSNSRISRKIRVKKKE